LLLKPGSRAVFQARVLLSMPRLVEIVDVAVMVAVVDVVAIKTSPVEEEAMISLGMISAVEEATSTVARTATMDAAMTIAVAMGVVISRGTVEVTMDPDQPVKSVARRVTLH
jgi:hypothetical protein